MSVFSVQARKHLVYYEGLISSSSSSVRTQPRDRDGKNSSSSSARTPRSSGDSVEDSGHSRTVSRTEALHTPRTRLTLQRRSRRRTGDRTTLTETGKTSLTPAPEKRLTLQRRTGTPARRKSGQNHRGGTGGTGMTDQNHRGGTGGAVPGAHKVLREPNGRSPAVFRSGSLRETGPKIRGEERTVVDKTSSTSSSGTGRLQVDPTFKTPTRKKSSDGGVVMEKIVQIKPFSSSSSSSSSVNPTFKTPTRKTPFEKIAAKRDVFEKLSVRKEVSKSSSLDRSRPRTCDPSEEKTTTLPVPPAGASRAGPGVVRSCSGQQVKTTSSLQRGVQPTRTSNPEPEPSEPVRSSEAVGQRGSFKMENSAVTVAVRVRPFNAREKAQKSQQVIFMKDQETLVQHPDSKMSYSFTFDLSFCSLDDGAASFASQRTVYERLARPLLLRAFEGFNACLFAYGQTGSGKSYTMMGFEEEAGVIPRFCRELFSRLTAMEDQEVKCHVELSYFEVYNEKIHDLLVTRDEPDQRRMPLRVREHPVHGPYVSELSANVVSSYDDIQGWLELGNKQRATAATGMNDKSSRSHSVFTLVMTQTKTECVEGEEHDHSITSRINLVDLAGSERCSNAHITGDRLREGVSINKSLLTLGKVISALSEQAVSRRKVFIPYRESVLTWLLKESLGGNSKTAMIATVSPAGSNVEESLSTLRYAQQARTIINVAKVNEDTSAKLIRELKAEVEKLRAAQMNAQGVEPERIRLFQQEVSALKNKLCQQEKEMMEAHRAWREKLDQAEIRKREETKELQKAGVTFKVDNRLPNLVNLNEDPQLSEMLLYMIKEGRTTVGQLQPGSQHDIQLSGALIAEQHCVISNIQGTVSITPMENAKTFVNGNLISESTVLHHGDRVILGGDHYFRFNHPAEVQSGKRVSCWTSAGDGHKDFEFAKNELLAAQRAQLEAEMEEAQLKAKEEMMQGIQMAKELAQKELSDQKMLYEDRIQELQKELSEEAEKTSRQQQDQQKVASEMAELKMAKLELEQEVQSQKKRLRLHMEAQAMEEHRVCQARIVEALEAEKRKIGRELEELQKKRACRAEQSSHSASPPWDAMKLSVMIEEANKISAKLKKHTVFSRHDSSESENLEVRVQNTKLGIATFWSLEKFTNNMAAMREIQQGDSSSKDDDVFYDPHDEWEQDISASSASSSSFSRRRSRSLLKSRRISGRLYEIRVHPIQSLHSAPSQSAGLMGVPKPPSSGSSSSDPALPGICKDLIGQSLSSLRGVEGSEVSLADRLLSDLTLVYTAAQTIADLYDGLDDDAQDSVLVCSAAAQTELLKATRATETAAFVTLQWLAAVKPSSGTLYTVSEELKSQVKKMGAFFQMLIQGCESEISSMVSEARRKSSRCLDSALASLAQLAAMTETPLRFNPQNAAVKASVVSSVLRGTRQGAASLLEENLSVTRTMMRDAQLAFPRGPDLQSLKSRSLDVSRCLQSFLTHYLSLLGPEEERKRGTEEEDDDDDEEAWLSRFQSLTSTSSRLLQLRQTSRRLQTALASALRGGLTSSCRDNIHSSSTELQDLLSGLTQQEESSSSSSSSSSSRLDLHSALQALTSWTREEEEEEGGERGADSMSSEEGSRRRMLAESRRERVTRGDPHWV